MAGLSGSFRDPTYLRNIYKYYVAYKLMLDAHGVAEKARQQVAPTSGEYK